MSENLNTIEVNIFIVICNVFDNLEKNDIFKNSKKLLILGSIKEKEKYFGN